MKRHRQALVLVGLATLLLAAAVLRAPADSAGTALTFSIHLSEATYVLGEPIIVRLSVSNAGATAITDRWFSYDGSLGFGLLAPAGGTVPLQQYQGAKAQALTTWECVLRPGQSITTGFDLTRGDVVAANPGFPKLAWPLSAPQRTRRYVVQEGTYTLLAYHDLAMNRSHEGVARYKSRKQFTIRLPSDVEARALALFEAQPRFSGVDAAASQADALGSYEKVWTQYPETPYAQYAVYYAARILQHQGKYEEALAKYDLLAKQYPGFPLPEDVLYYKTLALRAAGKAEAANASATTLKQRHGNHLVSPDVAMPDRQKGSRIQILAAEMGVQ